jgi:hypothetical protein
MAMVVVDSDVDVGVEVYSGVMQYGLVLDVKESQ